MLSMHLASLDYSDGFKCFNYTHRNRTHYDHIPDLGNQASITARLARRGIGHGSTSLWPVVDVDYITTVQGMCDRPRSRVAGDINEICRRGVHWPSLAHYATLSDIAQELL